MWDSLEVCEYKIILLLWYSLKRILALALWEVVESDILLVRDRFEVFEYKIFCSVWDRYFPCVRWIRGIWQQDILFGARYLREMFCFLDSVEVFYYDLFCLVWDKWDSYFILSEIVLRSLTHRLINIWAERYFALCEKFYKDITSWAR